MLFSGSKRFIYQQTKHFKRIRSMNHKESLEFYKSVLNKEEIQMPKSIYIFNKVNYEELQLKCLKSFGTAVMMPAVNAYAINEVLGYPKMEPPKTFLDIKYGDKKVFHGNFIPIKDVGVFINRFSRNRKLGLRSFLNTRIKSL